MTDAVRDSMKVIAKGGVLLFIGMLFSRVTAYAHRLVIARMLGPDSYGVFSLALAVIGIVASLAILGLDKGVERFTALYRAAKKPWKVYETISTVLIITVASSTFFMVALLAFAPAIAVSVFREEQLFPVLVFMSFLIPVTAFLQIFQRIFRAFKRIEYDVLARCFVENSLKVVLTLVLLLAGFGLFGVISAYAASLLISLAVLFYFFLKVVWSGLPKSKAIMDNHRELTSYSWPLFMMSMLNQLGVWIDVTLIGFLMTKHEVGIYSVAQPTSHFVLLFHTTILGLFLPVIMSFITSNDRKGLREVTTGVTRWITVSTLPVMVFFVLMATPVTVLVFGGEYFAASTALAILSVGMFLYAFSGGTGSIINAMGKSRWHLYNIVAFSVTNTVLNFFLIQWLGINGAALATAFSYALFGVLVVAEVRYLKGFFPYERRLLRVFAAAVVAAIPLYLLSSVEFLESGYVTLAVKFALFLFVYAAALLALKGMTSEDMELLRLFLAKVRRTLGKQE